MNETHIEVSSEIEVKRALETAIMALRIEGDLSGRDADRIARLAPAMFTRSKRLTITVSGDGKL